LWDKLLVLSERMRRNLDLTREAWFSPASYCSIWRPPACCAERAYGVVQAHAMRAWEEECRFPRRHGADPEIRAALKPEQIGEAFSLERQLRNVDKIFARVFGE